MQKIIQNKMMMAGLFLFVFTTFLVASYYIKEVKADYTIQTKLKIAEQETILSSIADLINRDGADAVVAEIIKDCSLENRARFDTLLSQLGTLKGKELDETKSLFGACANFFAQRTAVMVARLEREYEVYVDLVDLLSVVESATAEVLYNKERWAERVLLEKQRSSLSTELVVVQGKIIDALLENKQIASDDMQLLLVEGQQTKEKLTVITAEINNFRQGKLDI